MTETENNKTEAFPSSNFKPGDPGYLGDEFSGDYCEARDILLQETRHKMVDAVLKLSPGRICIAREHFLQLSAYNDEFKNVAIEVVLLLTRILAGDKEYDKEKLADDKFDFGDWNEDEE